MPRSVGAQQTNPSFRIAIIKLLLLVIAQIPLLRAAPLRQPVTVFEEGGAKPPQDPTLWIYLAIAVGLVLLGGAFAGLTIALMGQDEIYLQVIKTSGEGAERKQAARVLRLLSRGKHWVLVTLLLSNVITNETLPIVLDRSLGGGWPAVLGSTALIVIFGEIIPQSICVRYGLPIGAWMSPFVLVLMYVLGVVAWPTAKLLDWLLGKDHGTVYKKAGLKTLVTLHKTLGAAGEQLNSDEVTIISAVLDLKAKPVGSIMTPMTDVFTMSADTILDEKTMDNILSAGYSRIPIHAPGNKLDFVGMLLVKILITYDPEDCRAVRDFALATLPETAPETSCLDIVNFFQQGKSHMVLVSECPGENSGAIGVVTLEDVIEELIGEEIIDESDVYVDVHKAIRRMTPAPRTRVPKGEVMTKSNDNAEETEDEGSSSPEAIKNSGSNDRSPAKTRNSSLPISHSPKVNLLRRLSGAEGVYNGDAGSLRPEAPALRQRFSHLGPSNLASNPRSTRINAVKIKPGGGVADSKPTMEPPTIAENTTTGGVGEGILDSAGKDAKDGVQAVQAGYGSFDRPRTGRSSDTSNKGVQVRPRTPTRGSSIRGRSGSPMGTDSTVGSLPSRNSKNSPYKSKNAKAARSGSITENIIESGGIKKVVLETTSSSDDAKSSRSSRRPEDSQPEESKAAKRKRRRKRKKEAHSGTSESTPLLERD